MLTRLYIDNFRCFVNFDHRPARRELILGADGSGKSSLIEALLRLRLFAGRGEPIGDLFPASQRTRWLNSPEQIFEVEARIHDRNYIYTLVIDEGGSPTQPLVKSETLSVDGDRVFMFVSGQVFRSPDGATYTFDPRRSALATMVDDPFKSWIEKLYCFRINPFSMGARAEGDALWPSADLLNLAPWYRRLLQSDPQQYSLLIEKLGECLDGFSGLFFEAVGQNASLLMAVIGRNSFYFNELSDGQRCLICLYIILHFLTAKGATVVIDEPDNFISLREIQPWLSAVTDAVEEGDGQVLLISHHPEIINQWAPGNGVLFVREGAGPVRVEKVRGDIDSCLTPSELVARGWESE